MSLFKTVLLSVGLSVSIAVSLNLAISNRFVIGYGNKTSEGDLTEVNASDGGTVTVNKYEQLTVRVDKLTEDLQDQGVKIEDVQRKIDEEITAIETKQRGRLKALDAELARKSGALQAKADRIIAETEQRMQREADAALARFEPMIEEQVTARLPAWVREIMDSEEFQGSITRQVRPLVEGGVKAQIEASSPRIEAMVTAQARSYLASASVKESLGQLVVARAEEIAEAKRREVQAETEIVIKRFERELVATQNRLEELREQLRLKRAHSPEVDRRLEPFLTADISSPWHIGEYAKAVADADIARQTEIASNPARNGPQKTIITYRELLRAGALEDGERALRILRAIVECPFSQRPRFGPKTDYAAVRECLREFGALRLRAEG